MNADDTMRESISRAHTLFRRHLPRLALVALLAPAGHGFAADQAPTEPDDPSWCPPTGPSLQKLLPLDDPSMLKPGWIVIQMRVKPGDVPVSDVRVASIAGGPSQATVWLPLVRQWRGCPSNTRDTVYRVKFNFGILGNYHQPEKEAFGLDAFKNPAGAPKLPAGDWGTGVCPIKATVVFSQPGQSNVVKDIEGDANPRVREWLETLAPNLDYMVVNPKGNRVEFDCKVSNGVVTFPES